MMAPHSKDLYEPTIIKDEKDLKDEIKLLKSKSSTLPNYIIIRKSHISSRRDQDIGYGQTYLLVYDTKEKSYTMFHSYDKNPFEFSIDMLRGEFGGVAETFEDAVNAFHENMQADYADSLLRKKKITKPKSKRTPVKKVIKKCKCKK